MVIYDLDDVIAEIHHHLDDVLSDDAIKTIIHMLKDYPKLKESSEKLRGLSIPQECNELNLGVMFDQLQHHKLIINKIKALHNLNSLDYKEKAISILKELER